MKSPFSTKWKLMETMQKPEDNVSPKVNNKIKRRQNNMGTVSINFDLKKKSSKLYVLRLIVGSKAAVLAWVLKQVVLHTHLDVFSTG